MLGSDGRTCKSNLVHTYQQRSVIVTGSSSHESGFKIHKRRNDSQPEDVQETYNYEHSTSVYVW